MTLPHGGHDANHTGARATAAAFSRAIITESRHKSGIGCRFAAGFASTPRSIETPG
jgi:hypothetical protein